MYSLNAPVPGQVRRLASDLHPQLVDFAQYPSDHTLLAKRLDASTPSDRHRVQRRVRDALSGLPPFAVRIDDVDHFANPTSGTGPVVYLTVDSPGLRDVHDRLVDELGSIDGLGGDDYVPHITLARDGPQAAAERAATIDVDPIEWTVERLEFYDAHLEEPAGEIRLPA
ncbi:2'-5' RNA ligase family protein [Halorubellus sp. PRR65]|uniref:2'-5' RNA ligase family protein n=1 Tax=Halorubellus sp. PRR65 TaxID=3098148 RepID=UPI002B25DA68|nr:2'-5' RNA ligase family protein [Halorubellus sp. PRR65]